MEVGTRVKVVRCHLAALNGLKGTIHEIGACEVLNIEVTIDGDDFTTPFNADELEVIGATVEPVN